MASHLPSEDVTMHNVSLKLEDTSPDATTSDNGPDQRDQSGDSNFEKQQQQQDEYAEQEGEHEQEHEDGHEAQQPEPEASEAVKLEDMFNDEDDDDEDDEKGLIATVGQGPADPPSPPAAPAAPEADPATMHTFYQRLFPFNTLFQWLNHSTKSSSDFANREFAFTLRNEAYLRYQSYQSADGLRQDILHLNPSRFEIGPVYSINPRDRKSLRRASAFRPVSKELVFDIDLTDYDDIRTCCTKANICSKCWAFVTMAIRVVDTALREDFGFEHILWVYSGRRGAHAWVCDPRARNLSDDKRRAVATYFELLNGGRQAACRVSARRPLHPHVSRSLEILKHYFANITLGEQDTFVSLEQEEHLLACIPDSALSNALRKRWEAAPGRSSRHKWGDIDALAKTVVSTNAKGGIIDTRSLRDAKQDVVLEYTYPRLDSEVSKKLIHLLKSPFVVHPGTGRVCVPIDVSKVDEFDPLAVPTVAELIEEIHDFDLMKEQDGPKDREEARGKVPDYAKTRLKPYVDYFRSFVAGLLRAERGVKRARGETDGEDNEGATSDPMQF